MAYREATALATLLAEVNEAAPERSKASDGWIGDAAHASRTSDHNPWVIDAKGVGVVRARDFTDDPEGGFSAAEFAREVAALLGKHPALGSGAYVIWNRQIISTDRKAEGWRPYSGVNAHKQHCHVSVGVRGYDSTAPWGVMGDDMAGKADEILAEVKALRAEVANLARLEAARYQNERPKLNTILDEVKD